MIVVTVLLSILNQMELHQVQNRKENCHHDHIPFNLKGNGNIVYSEYGQRTRKRTHNENQRTNTKFRSVGADLEVGGRNNIEFYHKFIKFGPFQVNDMQPPPSPSQKCSNLVFWLLLREGR